MNPAPGQWRGEDRHIAGIEAVHRVLVRVEPHELPVRGNVDLLADRMITAEMFERGGKPVLEGIGHRDDFGLDALGAKGVSRRAGATATAADQRDLNRRIPRRVDVRNRNAGQCRYSRKLAHAPAQRAAGNEIGFRGVHESILCN